MFRFINPRVAAAAGACLFAPAVLATAHSEQAAVLDPQSFKAFTLKRAEQLTHDTKRYTFELPREHDELGLTVASCLVVKADVDGKAVVRPYTPTSPVNQRGSFELIVKTYPEGKVSKALWDLKEGSSVEMKGPFKKFDYQPNQWEAVGMVAGGTGITPMYQLIQQILANPRDRTEIRLVYASRTPGDIILKAELDALAAVYPNFKVFYTVDKADANWKGNVGYITRDILASQLPPPSPKHKVLVCGPPGFMKLLSGEKKSPTDQGDLVGLLKDMKYEQDQVFKF